MGGVVNRVGGKKGRKTIAPITEIKAALKNYVLKEDIGKPKRKFNGDLRVGKGEKYGKLL